MNEGLKLFLMFNAAVVCFLVFYYLKRGSKKTPLNFRLKSGSLPVGTMGGPRGNPGLRPIDPQPDIAGGSRDLNVIFNFNGHSWDAYEVLGLPAGSSPDQVETAYRMALEKVDESSKEFIHTAFRAIKAKR